MTTVFTDTSRTGLKSISRDHFFESLECFSVLSDIEVHRSPELTRMVSPGIPNSLTNAVFRCRLSIDHADDVIDATHAYFQSCGVAPYWRLCPDDLPSDLEQRLVAKGLSLKDEQYAMALDLRTLSESTSTPDNFTVEHVVDAATLKEKNVILKGAGTGKSLGSLLIDLFSIYGFDSNSRWHHYIGLLAGKPVSCASVFYATGVAGIYMVATVPEARRQGIGRAVTLQALLDARERGYRVAVLQSSKMGYNVYRKLGFRDCFTIKYYAPVP